MNNLTKKIFYDFVSVKSRTDDNYPLDELFFDDAIDKVAQENHMEKKEVETLVFSALAENRGLDFSAIESIANLLRSERKEAHSKAEDWKESLMAEREIIEKQKEMLGVSF